MGLVTPVPTRRRCVCAPCEVQLTDRIRGKVLSIGAKQNIEAQVLCFRSQSGCVAGAGLHHNAEFSHARAPCSFAAVGFDT